MDAKTDHEAAIDRAIGREELRAKRAGFVSTKQGRTFLRANPRQVAGRLLRSTLTSQRTNGFGRQLNYPRSGVA